MRDLSACLPAFAAAVAEAMQTQGAVGMACGLFDRDGHALYQGFWGQRDRAQGLPIDEHTVFGLASITKSFTALCIHQLAARGQVELDAPVQRYLPAFARRDICVRHLLSHCAGFYPLAPHDLPLDVPPETDEYLDPNACQRAADAVIAGMNAQTAFTGAPGAHFSYSNDGYGLLSEIVRLRGGCATYAQYVEQNVLLPLGMTRSACKLVWDDPNVTRLYARRTNGELTGDWRFREEASTLPGAGGMKSTLHDMGRYAAMFLRLGTSPDGTRLLPAASVMQMVRPVLGCGLNEWYGHGLTVRALPDLTVVGHGGDMPGISARLGWSYALGIAVVALCNTSQVGTQRLAELALRLCAGQTPEAPRAPVPVRWSESELDAVCGAYRSAEGAAITVRRQGEALAVNINGAATTAEPIDRYSLRVRTPGGGMRVRVYRRENGEVYAVGGGYRMIPRI